VRQAIDEANESTNQSFQNHTSLLDKLASQVDDLKSQLDAEKNERLQAEVCSALFLSLSTQITRCCEVVVVMGWGEREVRRARASGW